MHPVGSPDRALACLREAEEPHLPLGNEIGHGADYVLDRYRGIYPMLIQEIDVVGTQPAERAFDGLADVRRAAIQLDRALFVATDLEPELRSDHDLVSPSLDGPADQLLVGERPIHLGGVEEGATQLDGPMNGGDGFPVIPLFRRSVRLTHAHAAETEGGHGQSLAS
jgi:hypothetical protein